jgi:hypothetical protein
MGLRDKRSRTMKLALFFILFPLTIFAALTGTDRGTGANTTTEASTTIQPSGTLAAHSSGVLCLALDNANAVTLNTPTSITDSVGNVWYRRTALSNSGANTAVESAIYSARIVTPLTSSDSIVVTYTAVSVTAKAWTITEVVPSSGNYVLFSQANTGVQSATGAPTINTQQVTLGQMVVAMGAAESADTWAGDADTTNGTWSTQQHNGAGTGAAGMSISSQNKVVTASAIQTYNPTLTSADTRLAWAFFQEADIRARASAESAAIEATTTIDVVLPLASGSMGVLCVAADNNGAGGSAAVLPTSITDSKSNTWTLQKTAIYDPGAAAAGVEIGIYTSTLTTSLVVGDTLTMTYQAAVSVTGKCWSLWEFSNATGYSTGGVGAGSTTASPSITTSSITAPNYVIAMAGAEGDNTWVPDSDTTNGTWSTMLTNGSGTGLAGMTIISQYKTVSTSGTQTYNPTLTSADVIDGWIELTAPATQNAFFTLFVP